MSTLKDVAKRAKVDPSTVSLVINGNKRIPEKTRARILKIIKEMNYVPHQGARTLASGRTNTIAIVSFSYSSLFAMTVLKGIEMKARNSGFNHLYFNTNTQVDVEERIFNEIIYGKKADVIIGILMTPEKEQIAAMKKNSMAYVSVNEPIAGAVNIEIDDFKGAYTATGHLIKNNRKKIAFITGKQQKGAASHTLKARLSGYKKALEDNGIAFDKSLVREVVYYSFEDGEEALGQIMKIRPDIDAAFCASGDMVAFGVMKEAARMKIRIPQDLNVIGYDDVILARAITPALTTVRQPIEEMGAAAYEAAAGIMKGEKIKQGVFFEPELIIRETT